MMTLILDNISFVEAFRSYSMVTMLLVVAVVIAFVIVFVSNRIIVRRVRKTTAHTQEVSGIMQRALVLGRIHVLHFMPSTRTIRQVRGSVLSQEEPVIEIARSTLYGTPQVLAILSWSVTVFDPKEKLTGFVLAARLVTEGFPVV